MKELWIHYTTPHGMRWQITAGAGEHPEEGLSIVLHSHDRSPEAVARQTLRNRASIETTARQILRIVGIAEAMPIFRAPREDEPEIVESTGAALPLLMRDIEAALALFISKAQFAGGLPPGIEVYAQSGQETWRCDIHTVPAMHGVGNEPWEAVERAAIAWGQWARTFGGAA